MGLRREPPREAVTMKNLDENAERNNVATALMQWRPSFPMTLDRIGGTWVVTGWTTDEDEDDDAALRVRISLSLTEDAVRFQFDIAASWTGPFVEVGDVRWLCVCGGWAEDDTLFSADGAPQARREQFREMVSRWALVTLLLEPMDEQFPALPVARLLNASGDAHTDASQETCQ
jgi:hypothetical protein